MRPPGLILDGKLIADGTPAEIKQALAGRMLEVVPSGDPFDALATVSAGCRRRGRLPVRRRLRAVAAPGALDARARPRWRRSARSPRPSRRSRTCSSSLVREHRRPARGEGPRMNRLLALTSKEFLPAVARPPDAADDRHGAADADDDLRLRHQLRRQAPADGGARRVRAPTRAASWWRGWTASQYFDLVGSVGSFRGAALRRSTRRGLGRRSSSTATSARTAGGARRRTRCSIVNASDTTTSTQAMSIAAGIANAAVDAAARRAGALAAARAAGRPARAALVQPGPAHRQLHHPRAARDHPDVHADQLHRRVDRP